MLRAPCQGDRAGAHASIIRPIGHPSRRGGDRLVDDQGPSERGARRYSRHGVRRAVTDPDFHRMGRQSCSSTEEDASSTGRGSASGWPAKAFPGRAEPVKTRAAPPCPGRAALRHARPARHQAERGAACRRSTDPARFSGSMCAADLALLFVASFERQEFGAILTRANAFL